MPLGSADLSDMYPNSVAQHHNHFKTQGLSGPLLLQAGEEKITPGNKFHLAIFCSKGTMSQVWELVLGTPLRNSNSLLNIG